MLTGQAKAVKHVTLQANAVEMTPKRGKNTRGKLECAKKGLRDRGGGAAGIT